MSRALRLNNKEAFQGGTLKKGIRLRRTQNYQKLALEKKDKDRRITAYRKCILGNLSNEIVQLGSIVKLEDISYKALQKRYGKSVGESAPTSLKTSLFRTSEKLGGRGELINTFQTRLSQTCLCGEIKKKTLQNEIVHSLMSECERALCPLLRLSVKFKRKELCGPTHPYSNLIISFSIF